MPLSEQDMKFATDIAYLDLELLNDNMLQRIPGSEASTNTQSHSIRELLELPADSVSCYPQSYFDNLASSKMDFGDSNVSLNADKINQLPNEVLDWKIVETFNQNNPGESGFYGTVIDTGEGLIVSFRGSEDPSELQNIQQDWISADLGLIAGELTDQQKDANAFIEHLIGKGFFDNYDDITFAGHSLGGNLAEHSTFYAAEMGVADKISTTISYDGPGFTEEYLLEHRENIQKATDLVDMKHVEQSLVGSLMQRIDGIDYKYAKLQGEGYVQHGTENVVFDDNGNIVTTAIPAQGSTILSTFVTSPLTEGLDRMISAKAGKVIVETVLLLTEVGPKVKDWLVNKDGSLTGPGKAVMTTLGVGLAALVVKLGPVGILVASVGLAKLALVAATVTLVAVAAIIVTELIRDAVEYLIEEVIPAAVQWIAEAIGKFSDWAKEQLAEFGNMLVTAFKELFQGFKNLFNSGPKAVATPYIKVDTYKLKNYANRLQSIKVRIRAIDSDLNALYFTQGLSDIAQLSVAEKLPTSWQMNKCINYLEDTAQAFESAENKIMGI